MADPEYVVYPARWLLLAAVILLNLANYAHWVAFPAVAKQAAEFYQVSGAQVDLIPLVSYCLCVPVCLLAVYTVERRGLRTGLLVGAWLTALGGGLCCLATLPGLWGQEWWSRSLAFQLTVLGQALTGIGCPFISCVPTKVSQNWFSESERGLATLLLGMSNPLGLVLGQLVTPLMVWLPGQVPLLNLAWFLPSLPGLLLTVVGVTHSLPPSPPSPSAATAKSAAKPPFLATIKQLFCNRAFLIIFLFLGGAMGYISTLQTKLEQILCSRGYSDSLAGLAAALIIVAGFLASFPIGLLAMRTGKLILITKTACVPAVASLVLATWVLLQPSLTPVVLVTCVALGVFSLGIYPVMLELSVECTYPLDESVVTGLCYLSSAVQGSLLMAAENYLQSPLTTERDLQLQTCHVTGHQGQGGLEAKNFTKYLIFINTYMIILITIYLVFFTTDYKRSKENSNDTFSKAVGDQEIDREVLMNSETTEVLVFEHTNTVTYADLAKPDK